MEEQHPFIFARNIVKRSELYDMQRIAERSGKSYWYIRALACGAEKSKPPFPEPFTKVGRMPLWRDEDLKDWFASRE